MRSKYQVYISYKDSGVDWLGKVPEHWENHRIDWISKIIRGNTGFKKDELLDKGKYVALQYGKTYKVDEVNETFKFYVNDEFYKLSQVVHGGDTILISTSETIDDLGHSCFYNRDDLGLIGGEQILLKPYTKFAFGKYLYYSSVIFCNDLKKYATGLKVFRFSIDDLKNIFISLPSLQEQQTIANYLDKATAKIDTLIEKQTKLIELLKEKRQAVISTAVTRGLDSSVPMKDSGVEWLGEIPKHWISTKIKNMLSTPVTDGPHETPEFLYEGVPFVSAEAISKGYINFNKIRGHISLEDNKKYSQKYSPKLHDVYMIKSGATTGITAIVEDRIDFNIWSPLAVFRANSRLNPYYLLNYLRSSNFQKAVELYWSYGTQQNIGMNVLENLDISIPPIEEQNDIANYLDDKISKIDNLITKATKAIDLLKERRTALISAVVTGKIDVRENNEKD